MTKKVENKDFQWYIVSVVTGNENSVIKNLWGKIEAYGLSEYVEDIRTIKDKVVEEEIFNEDNLPVNYGRNTKNIKWETFKDSNGNKKFKKIKTTSINRFSGYIFIKMILTEQVWFAIRNTQLITGIVGSSGKNAKPIPISDDEIVTILENKPLTHEISKNHTNDDDSYDEYENDNKEIVKDNNKYEDEIVSDELDEINTNKVDKYECNFSVGQNVKVIKGPFKDSIGLVESIDLAKGICTITINLFGRDTYTEISFDDVVLDK